METLREKKRQCDKERGEKETGGRRSEGEKEG